MNNSENLCLINKINLSFIFLSGLNSYLYYLYLQEFIAYLLNNLLLSIMYYLLLK